MVCPKCNTLLPDNNKFCTSCGFDVRPSPYAIRMSTYAPPSMGLYKFLINFFLVAYGLINGISGVETFLGLRFGEASKFVYSVIPFLQLWDPLSGILLLCLAGFAIYTRFQLSAYRSKAHIRLIALFTAHTVFGLLNCFVIYKHLGRSFDYDFYTTILASDLFSSVCSTVLGAVMAVTSILYFRKRAFLFCE